MPLYEYRCKKCHHIFEKIQQFSDRPVKKCPQCGGPVERLVSAPAVQFKGSGWYVTDYARKGGSEKTKPSDSAPAPSSDKDGAKASEKSESKKTESKPESKAKK